MSKSKKTKNLKWLSRALPLKSLTKDKLFREYFEYVKNLILSINPPFVIGISGEWGRGKTTLFNFLEEDLKNKYSIVRFESWKYQRTGNLSYSFVESIVSILKDKSGSLKKEKRNLLKQSSNLLKQTSNLIDVSLSLGPLHIKPDINKIYKSIQNLEGNFEKIIKKILEEKQKNQLIVFVDDLDRCLPEFALDFLENVKHFFTVENVIFVIALDEELLETALHVRYKNNNKFTSKVYLEKIFDLFTKLPNYKASDLVEYTRFLLEEKYPLKNITKKIYIKEIINIASEIPEVEKSTIMTNPRKLDRIVKNIMIAIQLVPKSSILHQSYPLFFLMLVLREYYYNAFKFIKENKKEGPYLLTSIWREKTRNQKIDMGKRGSFSIGTIAMNLSKLSQKAKDFAINSDLSDLAELIINTMFKEYKSEKIIIKPEELNIFPTKLASEIDKSLF